MKRLFTRIKPDLGSNEQSADSNNHIVGSWRLSRIVDLQNGEAKPHWKEVWSFAAMDDAETDGVFVCDYKNLHSVVGKWVLNGGCLRLVRQESEMEYIVAELSEKRLVLKNCGTYENLLSLIFDRNV